MREQNLERFSDYNNLSRHDSYYLHYLSLIKDLKYAIDKYSRDRLLDIGCGNKPYENLFKGKVTQYFGCDIIQSSLNKADLICEATNIPLVDASFDTIFSTQTIEHIADHQSFINESFRLLKPGGYFIISGPMYWPLHEEPYDYFRFTKHGYKYILEKAGFDVIEILSNGGMWATTGQSIIHSFTNSNSKKTFLRFYKFVFFKLRIYWLINLFYGWLDKVDYNPINTMNYVIVAKKNN